jgi:hypothetical protein
MRAMSTEEFTRQVRPTGDDNMDIWRVGNAVLRSYFHGLVEQ